MSSPLTWKPPSSTYSSCVPSVRSHACCMISWFVAVPTCPGGTIELIGYQLSPPTARFVIHWAHEIVGLPMPTSTSSPLAPSRQLLAGVGVGSWPELSPADVPAAMPFCCEAVQSPVTRQPFRPPGLVMPSLVATCCCCETVQFPAVRQAALGGGDAPGWPAGTAAGDAVTVAAGLHAATLPAATPIRTAAKIFIRCPHPFADRSSLPPHAQVRAHSSITYSTIPSEVRRATRRPVAPPAGD